MEIYQSINRIGKNLYDIFSAIKFAVFSRVFFCIEHILF